MSNTQIKGGSEVFEFVSYDLDDAGHITLAYRCGDHVFNELITLPSDVTKHINHTVTLDHALQLLHLIAGVSYFKHFVNTTQTMRIHYAVPDEVTKFIHAVYENGLGELLYKNKLSPILELTFESNTASRDNHSETQQTLNDGALLGLGGGKDSLVAAELLRRIGVQFNTFGVNGGDILAAQSVALKTVHTQVNRVVDIDAIQRLETEDGSPIINGHVPISAILSAIGAVVAIILQLSDVVVAVERSADEPTIKIYHGRDINHQWSKSSAYERAFDEILQAYVHTNMRFYSLLRPLKELDIMKLYFAFGLADKFKLLASSCNLSMAWTAGRSATHKLWDGSCDKCCFIYLLMSGAGHNAYAQEIMGHDLFADDSHKHTFISLLGLTDSKPFDCVGEIDESRESMDRAKEQIDSAKRFLYPATNSSVVWSDHHQIPVSIMSKIKPLIEQSLLQP